MICITYHTTARFPCQQAYVKIYIFIKYPVDKTEAGEYYNLNIVFIWNYYGLWEAELDWNVIQEYLPLYKEAASRTEYLQTGKVDIILADFAVTDERKEEVHFALPYMNVALGAVSHDDSVLTSLDDVGADDQIIVISGTTAEAKKRKDQEVTAWIYRNEENQEGLISPEKALLLPARLRAWENRLRQDFLGRARRSSP